MQKGQDAGSFVFDVGYHRSWYNSPVTQPREVSVYLLYINRAALCRIRSMSWFNGAHTATAIDGLNKAQSAVFKQISYNGKGVCGEK